MHEKLHYVWAVIYPVHHYTIPLMPIAGYLNYSAVM